MVAELEKTTDLKSGWQPTNSHPAKSVFDLSDCSVMASGVDTLYLSMYVEWNMDSDFFFDLDLAKKEAIKTDSETSLCVDVKDSFLWKFRVQKRGAKGGFEWLFYNNEYAFKVGRVLKAEHKPNVMVEIRSYTLWSKGPIQACIDIRKFLNFVGADKIHFIKPSRLDLCLDIAIPNQLWNESLLEYRITRADSIAKYLHDKKLQGFVIGKSMIHARLYDKILEIKQKSPNKKFMFDIWGIDEEPEGKKIIRVEFQLTRGILNELRINCLTSLEKELSSIWAYCTNSWLKFSYSPEKRPELRETMEWWKIVQSGFTGSQDSNPLARVKVFGFDEIQLFNQAYGIITSLMALHLERQRAKDDLKVNFKDCWSRFLRIAIDNNKSDELLFEDVSNKRLKFFRSMDKVYSSVSYDPANLYGIGGCDE